MLKNILSVLSVVFVTSYCMVSCSNNESSKNAESGIAIADAAKGKVMFNEVCSSCHGLSASDNKNSAPVLNSIASKWPDTMALKAYVHNAPAQMQSSDYTKALYEQWKTNIQMPPYIGMSQQEVADVVAYLYEL